MATSRGVQRLSLGGGVLAVFLVALSIATTVNQFRQPFPWGRLVAVFGGAFVLGWAMIHFVAWIVAGFQADRKP
jgi:fluoride ion exporter CrcB/FEX